VCSSDLAGNVQVMSAGSGIYHSEFNLESEDTTLYQIWIRPREKNISPSWGSLAFPKKPVNGSLPLLVSGWEKDKSTGALYIHQDAAIYGGRLDAGHVLEHPISVQAYILVSEGQIELDGEIMSEGDGAEVTNTDSVTIKAIKTAEVVVIDVPQARIN